MKIQKSGKTVTIDREELEVLVKHVGEFEKLVKTFERLEAAGKLASDFQRQWTGLKKVLEAEEARIAGTQLSARERRKRRCCVLSNGPLTLFSPCLLASRRRSLVDSARRSKQAVAQRLAVVFETSWLESATKRSLRDFLLAFDGIVI
jgi:hypothetical protein